MLQDRFGCPNGPKSFNPYQNKTKIMINPSTSLHSLRMFFPLLKKHKRAQSKYPKLLITNAANKTNATLIGEQEMVVSDGLI